MFTYMPISNPALNYLIINLYQGKKVIHYRQEHTGETEASIHTIVDHFRSLCKAQITFISQVHHLLRLVLTMPATNATSERSFSTLRRTKFYLRTTMLL
jgi:hypothetical protein